MGLYIKLNINMDSLAKKAITPNVKLYANSRLWAFCDEYVPMNTGMLASNVSITSEYVEYRSPYARRMYLGDSYNFMKDHHTKATSRWDKAMKTAKGDMLAKDISNAIKAGNHFMNTSIKRAKSEKYKKYLEALRRQDGRKQK